MKTKHLFKGLTDKQKRRTQLRADGLLLREIADLEGCEMCCIRESLRASEIKIKENLRIFKEKSQKSPKTHTIGA